MLTKNNKTVNPIADLTTTDTATVLKDNELACLKYMAGGFNNGEIAKLLDLSYYTIRDRVSVIINKLDGANRTEAVVNAVRQGLV